MIAAPGRAAPMTAAALGLALVLAACGGGSDPVSGEELVSEGDRICREGQERFAEIQAELPGSAGEAVEQTSGLVDSAREELDELEELEPPDDLKDPYERYLELKREALELLEEGRDAAEDQDAELYGELQGEVSAAAAERRKVAAEVGFKTCSSSAKAAGVAS